MDRLLYFRSQIVPGDLGTIVYWADRHDGQSFDIHESDIPVNAIITDVSYDKNIIQLIKTNNGFKPYDA